MVRHTVVGNLWRIYILNLEEIYKLSTTVRQTIFLEKGCCLLFHKDYWMRIIFFAHSLVNFLKHGHKWSKNQKNQRQLSPNMGMFWILQRWILQRWNLLVKGSLVTIYSFWDTKVRACIYGTAFPICPTGVKKTFQWIQNSICACRDGNFLHFS